MELDKKDRLIVNEMLKNSRSSFRAIANSLGMSTATVASRVRELEKNGLIKGYSALIDYDKAGFDLQAIIDIRVSKGKLLQVENRIAGNKNVQAVYDITGHFDCTVIAKFRTRRQLDSFVKKIQTFEFVERTETKLILNTIKENTILL